MEACMLCNVVVTNPVCLECVEQEIEDWLYETAPELVWELRRRTDEINVKFGATNCILCKEEMNICNYCYIQHVMLWLEQYPELMPEFKRYFRINYFN